MDIRSIAHKNHFPTESQYTDSETKMNTMNKVDFVQKQPKADLTLTNLQKAAKLAPSNQLNMTYIEPNAEYSVSALARLVTLLITGRNVSSMTKTLSLEKQQTLKELSIEELLAIREKEM